MTRQIVLLLFFTLIFDCFGDYGLRKELLEERTDWVSPGSSKIYVNRRSLHQNSESPKSTDQLQRSTKLTEMEHIAETARKTMSDAKISSKCQSQLNELLLVRELTDRGQLSKEAVYFRRLISAILKKIEARRNQKDNKFKFELVFDRMDVELMKSQIANLSAGNMFRLIELIEKRVNQAGVNSTNFENFSFVRQLWSVFSVVCKDLEFITFLRVCTLVTLIIALLFAWTCGTRAFLRGPFFVFFICINFLWHWHNMLRKKEAELLYRNPCYDSRAWYNPMRLFASHDIACSAHLRNMHLASSWEYSPGDVFLDMITWWLSSVTAKVVVQITGAVGDSIREFVDRQSWFSMLPAMFVLVAVVFIVIFKVCGLAISCMYFRLEPNATRFALPQSNALPVNSARRRSRYLKSPVRSRHRSASSSRERLQIKGEESDSYDTANDS